MLIPTLKQRVMYLQVYQDRKKYERFDTNHYLLYLNEQSAEFTPGGGTQSANEEPAIPVPGYSYTGDHPDGGTLIEAKENSYDTFVNGLIRKRYPEATVEAIQSNMIVALTDPENARSAEFTQEWNTFQEYRTECKAKADEVLSR